MKKIIEETDQHTIFIDYFEGNPIRFIYDKQRDELKINADDAFKALGYSGLSDFLGSDEGLDAISKIKEEDPNFDLFGDNGIFQKI
jgi:hypothetical protein